METVLHFQTVLERAPRVLVVEDGAPLRDSVYRCLDDAGYDVLSARNHAEALTIVRNSIRPVELLVTDYAGCNSGVDFSEQFLGVDLNLSVLYITEGEQDPGILSDVKRQRCSVLPKPFDRETLRRKVISMLLVRSTRQFSPAKNACLPALCASDRAVTP